MALRVRLAKREEAVSMAEFVKLRLGKQARNQLSPPNVPVTYYPSSSSINGFFSMEILQYTVNWLSTGADGVDISSCETNQRDLLHNLSYIAGPGGRMSL